MSAGRWILYNVCMSWVGALIAVTGILAGLGLVVWAVSNVPPAPGPMKVTWKDLGLPEEPGIYVVRGIEIEVKEKELAIWTEHPHAIFDVIFSSVGGRTTHVLGQWRDAQDQVRGRV